MNHPNVPHSRRARAVGWFAIAVLVGAGLWSVWAQRADQTRMPDVEVVREANGRIVDQVGERDLVRALPLWFDDARIGLDDATFSLSSTLDPYDAPLFDAVWLLYATSHSAEADEARLQLAEVSTAVDVPGYRIEVGVPDTGTVVSWDALGQLDHARVEREDGTGGARDCTRWVHDAWHCDYVDAYIYVARDVQEMDDTWRRCIYAAPPEPPGAWRISWDDVPLAETLRIRAGNTSWAVRQPRGQPVRLEVLLDDEVLLDRSWAIDEAGYPEWTFDTSARQGQTGRVSFRVSAADHFDRFFCFRAQTVASVDP